MSIEVLVRPMNRTVVGCIYKLALEIISKDRPRVDSHLASDESSQPGTIK